MSRTATGLITAVAFCSALAACAPTRHRPTVGHGGRMDTRIYCRTQTPHKCTIRAREVCGTYTVIEPLHLNPEAEVESTMVVHCDPPPVVPPAAAVVPTAASADGGA
jgi:hypothetical protein